MEKGLSSVDCSCCATAISGLLSATTTVGYEGAYWTVPAQREVSSWLGPRSTLIVDKETLALPLVNVGWDLLLSYVPRGTMFGVALDTH